MERLLERVQLWMIAIRWHQIWINLGYFNKLVHLRILSFVSTTFDINFGVRESMPCHKLLETSLCRLKLIDLLSVVFSIVPVIQLLVGVMHNYVVCECKHKLAPVDLMRVKALVYLR